jgi:hypothetical protein
MSYQPHPFFRRLFDVYTGDPASIGMQLTQLRDRQDGSDPLLVCTGSDIVLFPGSARPPTVESFRRTTRGFIELAAVSHLPLAVGWLARMREIAPGDPMWRQSARELIQAIHDVQAINTVALWRDDLSVAAWQGLEIRIAALVDYSCRVTLDVVEKALRDADGFTFERLRLEYLNPRGSARVPVSMNEMMFATFALTFLDIGHRITAWLRSQAFDWNRLMVLISGRSGRPTAGLTWDTNNLCHLIQRASRDTFDRHRLYIAPHAPPIDVAAASDPARAAGLESQFRSLWFNLRVGVEMGSRLFDGDPVSRGPEIAPASRPDMPAPAAPGAAASATAPPAAAAPATAASAAAAPVEHPGRPALIAQLRLVLEDPTQLLSNVAAQYVLDQLAANNNNPTQVFIAGFSDVDYLAARAAVVAGS